MTRSRVRTSVAAFAAATVLVTAGCGVKAADDGARAAGGGVPAPEVPGAPGPVESGTLEGTGGIVYLRDAADATASFDSMSMTMTMEMSDIPLTGDMAFTVESSIDNAAEKAHMTMDMGDMFDALGSLGGEMLPEDAGLMEMVVVGDTTYVKSSLFEMMPGVEADKPWFEAPSDEMSDSEMFGQGTNDPTEFLDFLRNNGSEVTEVGTEEVRGVETTHLQTVLDTQKMIENASPEEAAELEASIEDLGADGIFDIPVDVWVDADGIVRKMVMEMDLSQAESDGVDMGDASMTITVEMFDFGQPVDIEVPDPSEVQVLDVSLLGD